MGKAIVLDHGYVSFVEAWGHGTDSRPEWSPAGASARVDMEKGIIEAARQSTQGAFRDWAPYEACEKCGGWFVEGDDGAIGIDPACAHAWKKYPKGDFGLLSFLFNSKPQHATPFEFAGMVIEVQAPIFVFREWHRHRTQSYNEMSARYAPLPDLSYVPTATRVIEGATSQTTNKQAGAIEGVSLVGPDTVEVILDEERELLRMIEAFYQKKLDAGFPKELARTHLNVSRYSRMRAQANLRNWLAFLTLRSDKGAQWEIRQYANAVGALIADVFPRTWKLFDLARNDVA